LTTFLKELSSAADPNCAGFVTGLNSSKQGSAAPPGRVETMAARARIIGSETKHEAAMRALMRMIEALALAAALWAATASAQESTAARSRAIVERQFDAFARDDAQGAYALADPAIKEMFVDADRFMAMVRKDYAPVYRHRSVEFGAFAQSGDEASLEATLVDSDNVEWTALYSLRKEANGDWLISGCVLVKSANAI
jgi:ketosteroid isomerase-like protein